MLFFSSLSQKKSSLLEFSIFFLLFLITSSRSNRRSNQKYCREDALLSWRRRIILEKSVMVLLFMILISGMEKNNSLSQSTLIRCLRLILNSIQDLNSRNQLRARSLPVSINRPRVLPPRAILIIQTSSLGAGCLRSSTLRKLREVFITLTKHRNRISRLKCCREKMVFL